VRVAVIIPVRNRVDMLERCLCSISEEMDIGDNVEIIICDDGSDASLSKSWNRFRDIFPNIRILAQKPKGPAAARNMGIRSSNADVLIFLDSDVVLAPNFLRKLVKSLEIHPEWLGAEACVESTGLENPLWDAPVCQKGGRYHTAAIAYRRKALIQAGGFDENFKLAACEDVELAYRVLQHGPIGFVAEAVAYHPARRVSIGVHWQWRKHWKYELILAKRHGFLAFPNKRVGRFARLKVAFAAIVTLPAGRVIEAADYMKISPSEGVLASLYAIFGSICGLLAVPSILFSSIPKSRNYLPSKE
jgi:GT2 family glycosyltransferase